MSSYRVIIVDDERMAREGIAETIEWTTLGMVLAGTAVNGQQALEKIQELQPDVVITDIKMPIVDGLQLIEQGLKISPHIVFIVLSGFGEFELATQAMRFGVRRYLLKPSDEHEITEALQWSKQEVDAIRSNFAENTQSKVSNALASQSIISSSIPSDLLQAIVDADEAQLMKISRLWIEQLLSEGLSSHALQENNNHVLSYIRNQLKSEYGISTTRTAEESQDIQAFQKELGELYASYHYRKIDKKAMLVIKIKQLTIQYIQSRRLSLQWLAQHYLFLNSEYLGKLFRQDTGEKYTQFLTSVRMKKAKELLLSHPTMKIYEVAEQCGFEQDPQYFSNVFKKFYGFTPNEYRKQQLENN
ncbi:two component transcriptional regulator, AraC family [Paenibacillus sp. OK060]|uniref:response regulator transcription factor n=1 Tax=Paenibacillus sp. OK060 TaxID=1881034 RepID=UPI00088EA118|nr:response regulator [Paenibacillus sp. OK060]SDK41640.1 two component transcriptional regulator, AraC family [Paenibacillus sp. OK060]